MMNKFNDTAAQISSEIYQRFRQALELGKWPDGRVLTLGQKEICMEAVLIYEAAHQVPESQRVGYIDRTKKTAPCGTDKSGHDHDDDGIEPVRIFH
jgi:uncharacterized protein